MIKLPSGLTGEVRPLSGKDGRALSNEKMLRDNAVEDFILNSCWVSTIDPGPYVGLPQTFDWDRILLGDRVSALIQIRIATYPDEPYVTTLRCPSPACKRTFEWEIDLALLLAEQTRYLSDEDRATFANGGVFKDKIPHLGTPFTFKIKTGAESKRLLAIDKSKRGGSAAQQASRNPLIENLAASITSIEGVGPKHADRFDFLEEQSLRVVDGLLSLLEEHDCGVDLSDDATCVHCGEVQDFSLPFLRTFFLPSNDRSKSKTRKSASDLESARGDEDPTT